MLPFISFFHRQTHPNPSRLVIQEYQQSKALFDQEDFGASKTHAYRAIAKASIFSQTLTPEAQAAKDKASALLRELYRLAGEDELFCSLV